MKKITLLIALMAIPSALAIAQGNEQNTGYPAAQSQAGQQGDTAREPNRQDSKSDTGKAASRAEAAATVLKEITSIPEKSIPAEIMRNAKCVIVLPGVKKAGFVIGGRYGRGFATCRGSS